MGLYHRLLTDRHAFFPPTRPNFLKPQMLIHSVRLLMAKQNQKAPRYPSIKAFGLSWSNEEWAVILFAIRAANAKPMLFPICDMVLNTPPANPCVVAGNLEVMRRLDTMKSASSPIGMSEMAGKAHTQYDQRGFTIAMRSGERQEKTEVTMTIQ